MASIHLVGKLNELYQTPGAARQVFLKKEYVVKPTWSEYGPKFAGNLRLV